jgi:preprotein translocase subunit SecG
MGFLIVLLTVVMVLDCLMLMFLVLIQLPKKETGAGLAFGAAATDALFGAGSGNVLTKITKYATAVFFILAIALSVMQSKYHSRTATEFQENLAKPIPSATAPRPTPTAAAKAAAAPVAISTNTLLPVVEATNTPAAAAVPAASNAPAGTNSAK